MSFRTPEWVKDAVFYQIFPDRFARSERVPKATNLESWDSRPTRHGYKGGDLRGVTERLDYIEALGVNAIYFCPVFQSGSNHRYHTHDYHNVDPMLGGNEALRELIDAAHERGIRVVLDGVFNHASRGFFQFHDILENGEKSAYVDWFHVDRFPVRAYDTKQPVGYKAWWNYPALPKFNTDSPAVREFLWDIGEKWIAFGADGWRLDVPNEIDDDAFWREFRRRVKAKAPDAYIVGEIWEDARRWLRGDQFDAVMNYLFTRLALGFFGAKTLNVATISECGLKDTVPLDAAEFARGVEGLLELYPWEVTLAQMNLLDSHDTPRFISAVSGDKEAFKLATLFQMAYPGAPCVYYGDEVGVEGLHDPDCRRGMPWAESDWDADLLRYVSRAIALRKSVPALRRGRYRTLQASGMQYAFERHLETQGSWAVVILNAGTAAATFRLSGLTDGRYRDAWEGGEFLVRNGDLELKGVKARSGLLLVKQ